jgi:hypothetical protein
MDSEITPTCVKKLHQHDAYQNRFNKQQDKCGVDLVLRQGQCFIGQLYCLLLNSHKSDTPNDSLVHKVQM